LSEAALVHHAARRNGRMATGGARAHLQQRADEVIE
jgi:hypothetical protein